MHTQSQGQLAGIRLQARLQGGSRSCRQTRRSFCRGMHCTVIRGMYFSLAKARMALFEGHALRQPKHREWFRGKKVGER